MGTFLSQIFEKRLSTSLGFVFWFEAPAIVLVFVILANIVWVALESLSFSKTGVKAGFFVVIFAGLILVCSYVWLVSGNTRKRAFSWLAKLWVIALVGVHVAWVLTAFL